MFDKGLVSRVYKQISKCNSKNQIEKEQKTCTYISPKKTYESQINI